MKSKLISLLLLILCFFVVGCEKPIEQPKKEITELKSIFTVSQNIKSNSLYQHSSKLLINGSSEAGAVIKATLYSEKESAVSTNVATVNDDGTYEIVLDTPSGSFEKYSLIVTDYHNNFIKEYQDILFGEINLLFGDKVINQKQQINLTSDELNDFDSYKSKIYLFDACSNDPSWNVITNENELSSFMYYLSTLFDKTSQFKKMPLGFYNILVDELQLIEWISLDSVKNNNNLLNYFKSNGKYYEKPYEAGQMSYYYNNILSKIKGLSFSYIAYSGGEEDFIANYSKEDSNNYKRILFNVLNTIIEDVCEFKNITIIQSKYNNLTNVDILCNSQNDVSHVLERCNLIPTFDINDDNEFMSKLTERFYDISMGKVSVSKYANYYISGDNVTLTIEFNNSSSLIGNVNGIKIYDKEGNLINFEDEKIIINNNSLADDQIIIDLSYEYQSSEDSEVEIMYYNISKITYLEGEFDMEDVIVNSYDLPVLPFTIIIE